MFRYLISYFWGSSYDEQSLDNAYAVLNELKNDESRVNGEHKFSSENFEYSNKCVRKTGIITALKNGCYIINDIYKFKCNFEKLEVGATIYFTVNTKNGIEEVSDISIADEYGCSTDNGKTSCLRTFVCKVNSRNGRQLSIIPGDITINLDAVSSEFVPIVGDWMEVEAKVELDENITDLFGKILQVDVIRPLRPRILRGSIRTWCDNTRTGSIDAIVFFTGDALLSGYIPIIGDQVVTEVIESDQGRYVCRSLKVIPENLQPTNNKLLKNSSSVAFETNVKGIFITDNININANGLNETHTFSLQVTNNLTEDLILLSADLPTSNFQCKIIEPTLLTNLLIKSNETINFLCLCVVKSVGITRELILFSFERFKIGRWVVVNVKFNFVGDNGENSKRSRTSSKTYFKLNNKDVIRGQKLSLQPRFTSNRLPDYPVPEKLLAVFYKCTNDEDRHKLIDDLRLIRPCLSLPFTFNIYEDRFHALLHLLEINDILAMQTYRQDEACLIKNGEFLMLEIENLAERRPSLICGDQIIVKNTSNSDADEYEGVIHKIGSKHIYVKFSSIFHDNFDGERVAVMAISSRTRFRRMHQAIGLVIRNLGKSFLFPSKLLIKNPQINFDVDVRKLDIVQNELVNTQLIQQQINTALETLNSNEKRQICRDISNTAIPLITSNSNNASNQICYSESLKYFQNDISKNSNENFGETSKLIFKLEWYNKNLNFYQKQAIKNILLGEARPLPYIIFGPPGTGKTVTLVEVILQLIRLIPHSRLLIATPSNSAADLVATRLIDSGVLKPGDLIRLVAHHIAAEDAVPVHLIPYSAVADIARSGTGAQSCDVKNSKLTIGYNSSVIGRHRITVGTCSALGVLFNMGFSKGHFTHIIVDEAGQLMEPEIMIPLSFLDISSGQVILAGDPLQLGPVIISQAASTYGLEETYMERMMSRFPFARDLKGFPDTEGYDPRLITQLLYNYRSLPLVLNLFNKLFYGSQLIATISSKNSSEAHLLNSIREILPCQEMDLPPSIVFHGVLGENYQTHDSPSWFNPDEASQIFFYVNELYRLGLQSSDIGIISPYIKQIKQIRSLLTEAEFQVPKIGTVEEFQGQEFNVILLSTVRSNYNLVEHDLKYNIGFISNPRRVNVAISRAKILMVIVGNPYLLQKDVLWRNIINYCIENRSCCGCDLQMLI